jgi:hypothetical protein
MRIRSVKPDFWRDRDTTGRWPADMKLLYVGLWNVADDEGRLELDLDLLAADLDPFRATWPDLAAVLDRISSTGCLVPYEIEGRKYGFIPKFKDHQKPNKPTPSKLPSPPRELPESSGSGSVALPAGGEGNRRGEGEEQEDAARVAAHLLGSLPEAAPESAHPNAAAPAGDVSSVESFRRRLAESLARTAPHPVGGGKDVLESVAASLRAVPEDRAVELCRERVLDAVKRGDRQPGTLAYFAQILADEVVRVRAKPRGNGMREYLGHDIDGKALYREVAR